MKRFILVLLFQCVILIVISQPTKRLTGIGDKTNRNYGAHSDSSSSKTKPQSCRTNQYFDVDKDQCLSVFGGGKALYINNTKSCGSNVLKPHCTNPRYYYICKEDKTILVQCPQHRHFESRLQKCILVPHEEYASAHLKSNASNPAKHFECHKQGSYPVPNNCGLFYTCTMYAYRMYQNFYTCPKNMIYDAEMEMCKPSSSTCQQLNQPLCSDNNRKENMTLEEAEKPMHPSKMTPTRNKEKSMMCETIFTNDEETTTTIPYNDDEIMLTTASYTEPPVSQFPGTSDSNAMTITTERASEMSRSANIDDSAIYTTEMYPTRPKETTLNHEENSATEMGRNEESEFSTSRGSIEEEHTTIATAKTDEQSSTEIGDSNTTPLILDDPTTRSANAEVQTSAETNACESCLKMTTTAEPGMKEQDGKLASTTIGQQITSTAAPAVSADLTTPSNTETEEQTNTEGRSSETITTGEPDIEPQHITAAATTIGQLITTAASDISADPTIPSSTESEVQPNTEGRSSGIVTTREPDVEPQHITAAETTIDQLVTTTAPAVSADPTTPCHTETEIQTNTEGRSSETITTSDPDVEEQHTELASTTIGQQITTAAVPDPTTPSSTETEVQRGTELSSDEPSLETVTTGVPNAKQEYTTIAAKIIQHPTANILSDSTTSSYAGTKEQRTTEGIPTESSLHVSSNEKPDMEEQQNLSTTEESKEESTTQIETSDATPIISTGTTMANKVITDRNENSENNNRGIDEQGSDDFTPTISPTTKSGNEDTMFESTQHNHLDRKEITESPSLVTTDGEPLVEDNSTTENNIEETSTKMSNTDVTESTDMIFTDSGMSSADQSSTVHYSKDDFTSSTSNDAGNHVHKATESTIEGENPTENFTPPSNNVPTDSVGNDAFRSTTVSATSTIDNSFVDSTSTVMPITTFSLNDVSESSTLPVHSDPGTEENTSGKKEESNTSSTTESNIMETDFPREVYTTFTTPDSSNLDNVTEGLHPSSTDTSINETSESVSQEDGLSTTSTSTEMNTDSTSNNTTRPSKFDFNNIRSHFKALYEPLYSWIVDKKNAFHQNKSIVEKESVIGLIHSYSVKTISQNIILSITSAVLSIADKVKHHIQRILTKILH